MSNINIKVNFDQIDQTKLFQGAKGRYFDIVLIETPNGKFGEFMAVQSVSKEERAAGIKGNILGNGKYLGNNYANQKPAPAPARRQEERNDDDGPSW